MMLDNNNKNKRSKAKIKKKNKKYSEILWNIDFCYIDRLLSSNLTIFMLFQP